MRWHLTNSFISQSWSNCYPSYSHHPVIMSSFDTTTTLSAGHHTGGKGGVLFLPVVIVVNRLTICQSEIDWKSGFPKIHCPQIIFCVRAVMNLVQINASFCHFLWNKFIYRKMFYGYYSVVSVPHSQSIALSLNRLESSERLVLKLTVYWYWYVILIAWVLQSHKALDVWSNQVFWLVTRKQQGEKDSLQSLASDPSLLIMSGAIRALSSDNHIMRFLPQP